MTLPPELEGGRHGTVAIDTGHEHCVVTPKSIEVKKQEVEGGIERGMEGVCLLRWKSLPQNCSVKIVTL